MISNLMGEEWLNVIFEVIGGGMYSCWVSVVSLGTSPDIEQTMEQDVLAFWARRSVSQPLEEFRKVGDLSI